MSSRRLDLATAMLVFWLMCTTSANAAENPTKMAMAYKLTELMQVPRIASEYGQQCASQPITSLNPVQLLAQNPKVFNGISPTSVYWPEILALFSNLHKKVCSTISAEKFSTFFAQQYGARLSEADLDAAIKFYSSAPGRRYTAASAEINIALQKHLAKEMGTAAGELQQEVQQGLQHIMMKFNRHPQ